MSVPVTISSHRNHISRTLEEIYHLANIKWSEQVEGKLLPGRFQNSLFNSSPISGITLQEMLVSAITNLTTCLVCKAVEPSIDCRYHREPGKGMPQPPDGPNN